MGMVLSVCHSPLAFQCTAAPRSLARSQEEVPRRRRQLTRLRASAVACAVGAILEAAGSTTSNEPTRSFCVRHNIFPRPEHASGALHHSSLVQTAGFRCEEPWDMAAHYSSSLLAPRALDAGYTTDRIVG